MELDLSTCYQAIASRDRRFEGRFVVAVTTTGIYCRPGCPAPIPRRKNVRFYPCAAAAEEAGFRACLRCRPDASPGTPAWQGTSATVSRALRLLTTGESDDAGGVEALAERVGIGGRHLRRLFLAHLGASPRAIAQSRRAHFARRLLDQTDLPMTAVALAAGYPSVRRFNDAIRRTFHAPPTELRLRRGSPDAPTGLKTTDQRLAAGGALTLKLPFHPPLDWDALAAFLAARATPGVEQVENDLYRRTIEWNGEAGLIEVGRPARSDRALRLVIAPPITRDLLHVVERVSRLFDLGADPTRITAFLGEADRDLARAVRRTPGLRVPGAWDPFELAVRAILGQQVSVRGATTLAGRLVREFGRELPAGSAAAAVGLTHLFPAPAALADAPLEGIGIPAARAATLRGLARAGRDGDLDFRDLRGLEEIVAALVKLPGIGDWTAHYIAMRAFGEPDAFPAADLGIRHALGTAGRPAPPREVLRRAEKWRPWRAYAVMALWQSLAHERKKK